MKSGYQTETCETRNRVTVGTRPLQPKNKSDKTIAEEFTSGDAGDCYSNLSVIYI